MSEEKRSKIVDLSDEQRRNLVCSMYLEGFTYNQIMKVTGYLASSTVYRIVKSHNLLNRDVNYSEDQVEQMIEFWRDRLTPGQIAIKMNLNKNQVEGKLRRLCLID